MKQGPKILSFSFLCCDRHGCWGVCYTYAIWFAVGALCVTGWRDYFPFELEVDELTSKVLSLGESKSETVTKALNFLLQHQRSDDGGWGEDFRVLPFCFFLCFF
jgi:hypothetical protein